MRILLSKRSKKNYRAIKDYITKEWGEKIAEAFEQKTIDFLDLLENFSEIGKINLLSLAFEKIQVKDLGNYCRP